MEGLIFCDVEIQAGWRRAWWHLINLVSLINS